ncbi:hypothetical protein OC835_002513 [Tilletia horrida]|nr:hypothetical protein OC835_002513 [Tilletia horrida]
MASQEQPQAQTATVRAEDVAEPINIDVGRATEEAVALADTHAAAFAPVHAPALSQSLPETRAPSPLPPPAPLTVPAISLDGQPVDNEALDGPGGSGAGAGAGAGAAAAAATSPAANAQPLIGASLASGEPTALIELEPLAAGASHTLSPTQLGPRDDGAHVDVVKDSKGRFFRRIIHSARSSTAATAGANAAAASRHKRAKKHYASQQVTYGLGHSRGAPVIVRVGQASSYAAPLPQQRHSHRHHHPQQQQDHEAPRFHGSDSAPVSRVGSRRTDGGTGGEGRYSVDAPSQQGPSAWQWQAAGFPSGQTAGSSTRSHGGGHHSHHSHTQAQLIGLGRANPLSGRMGSANPNRPYPSPSHTPNPGGGGGGRSSRPSLDSNAGTAAAAALGAVAGAASPPVLQVNNELLAALREIIRDEVRSAQLPAGDGLGILQGLAGEGGKDDGDSPTSSAAASEKTRHEPGSGLSPHAARHENDSIIAERGPPNSLDATSPSLQPLDEKKALQLHHPDELEHLAPPSGGGSGGGMKGADAQSMLSRPSSAASRSSLTTSSSTCSSEGEELDFPNPWARFRYHSREFFAEYLGTCVLLVFGNGINCQVFVSQLYDPSSPKGSYLSVSFGWGIGVAFGVWVGGGVSGAHLNPAVSIALAIYRGFPWRKVPVYVVAQILGAMTGALLVYGLLVFATAVLLIIIFAIGDAANTPPPDGLAPIALLWAIVGIGATLGWQTAYCVNPARDLGPRIMLAMVGYAPDLLWSFNAYYVLWVPILATVVGAVLGGFIYDALIYTGGESPLNARWRWSDVRWRRHSKDKMPAAISA